MNTGIAADSHVVVDAGDHDLHIHAASPRFDENLDKRIVRDEIGIGNVDGLSSGNDRQVIHDTDGGQSALGRAEDRLRRDVSSGIRRGKVFCSAHQFTRRFQPVLCKPGLKTHRARTLNANLNVVPVCEVLAVTGPLISDTRASRKRYASIHNERFSMIPKIETPYRSGRDAVVPSDLTPTLLQNTLDF